MRHVAPLAFALSTFALSAVGQPACLFEDGGFEGSASPTVLSGRAFHRLGPLAHGGVGYVLLGDASFSDTGSAYQDVTIPDFVEQAYLTFWLNITTEETSTLVSYDTLSVQLRDTHSVVLATLATYSNLNRSAGAAYSRKRFDLTAYRGQDVRIYFLAQTDFSLRTAFRIDDVALACEGNPPPPEPPDLVITAVGPLLTPAGDGLLISSAIANNGGVTASSFTANLSLSPFLKFLSCSSADGSCEKGSPSASFQNLTPEGQVQFDVVANVLCSTPAGAELKATAAVPFNDPWPGNNTDDVKIFVTNPVTIDDVAVDKLVLTPPNRKMVDVVVSYTASSGNCGPVSSTLQVVSNEPAKGKKEPDWQIIDPHHVRLRAERDGTGEGRIYTITIIAEDAFGHSSSKDVAVTVPHSP